MTGIQNAITAVHCATRPGGRFTNIALKRKPSKGVATTASLWLIADGMAPKTGARVACEMGDERAASVRKPEARPMISKYVFRRSTIS